MEIKEVRVGNWLNMEITDGWGIRQLKVNEFIPLFKHPNWAKPIPLTEEILLKCGFQKTNKLVGVRASYTFREIRVSLSNSGHWYFKQRIIYLHDLQNIVFALYGQELEVNL